MGLALERNLEAQPSTCGKRILFVNNADWFFLSHRKTLAHAVQRMGYEVHVASPDTGRAEEIRDAGFHFIELPSTLKGLSLNLFAELKAFRAILKLYRELQPDIVHHSTPKVVLMGTFAARAVKGMKVVNLISGLGYTFSNNLGAHLIRPLVCWLLRMALYQRRCTVFQNPDDRDVFVRKGIVKEENTDIIRGSGVDCSQFAQIDEYCTAPTVVLAARLLWDKGVGEFIESARQLKEDYPDARFVLVGKPDKGNPSSVPEKKLREWVDEGCIEWWGHRSDMPNVLAGSSMVVLPTSYPEGLPKILIEAGAAGRPVIATDIAGCREVVRHEVNGLLIPVHSATALTDAISRLLSSPDLRQQYGDAGRNICLQEFDEKIIADQFLTVCDTLAKQPVSLRIVNGAVSPHAT